MYDNPLGVMWWSSPMLPSIINSKTGEIFFEQCSSHFLSSSLIFFGGWLLLFNCCAIMGKYYYWVIKWCIQNLQKQIYKFYSFVFVDVEWLAQVFAFGRIGCYDLITQHCVHKDWCLCFLKKGQMLLLINDTPCNTCSMFTRLVKHNS
jgi:hypothetical protein